VRIARELHDQLIAHARAEAPNECCGMIATADGRAVAVHPAENAAASPLRYEIEGRDRGRRPRARRDLPLAYAHRA
jgi:proteasome lid subunit RPN8/RPN11